MILGETQIQSLDGYSKRMSLSLVDKMFFVDKVFDVEAFVDFGCADGTLVRTLRTLFPQHSYVGYDASEEMLSAARRDMPEDVVLTADWSSAVEGVRGKKSALILSSVIHEVHSYGSNADVEEFWRRVWGSGFDYVAIRDMAVSRTASRPSDPLAVARVRQLHDAGRIQQWESLWGSLSENWSLVHFFLTYGFEENWEREFRENYLPVPIEDLLAKAPRSYVPIHFEHYTLPWVRRQVEADFDVQLQEKTHCKVIFERRG